MDRVLLSVLLAGSIAACGGSPGELPLISNERPGLADGCSFVEGPPGASGATALKVERLVSGLEVPWGVAFLPGADALVTERAGRVRLVSGGNLRSEPVLTLEVNEQGEGGLLGIAVDPRFAENRAFYVYYTANTGEDIVNRVARYRLAEDQSGAVLERILVDAIPGGTLHNGGRLRFGPDGGLYAGTGDARDSGNAQDLQSLAGKLLRINPDGGEPEIVLSGIRNTQGFDWQDPDTLVISDHGPSGEMGLSGRDEVSLARRGENLGWPRITACEQASGLVTPSISWDAALPPGGLLVYRGSLVPSFRGDLVVTALGATRLLRVRADSSRESYLVDEYGRLRDVVQAPDGSIWVTTSNCDGRGECGPERDLILRITE